MQPPPERLTSSSAFAPSTYLGNISLPTRKLQLSRRRKELTWIVPVASMSNGKSKKGKKNKSISKPEDSLEAMWLSQSPGATPCEQSGHLGWREEDDAYWKDFVEREMFIRSPSSITPEDLELVEHPLDRDGNPTKYPAAMYFDEKTGTWVATSEEEEERLKKPNPIKDPFFVNEAEGDEEHTTMKSTDCDPTRRTQHSDSITICGIPPWEKKNRNCAEHRRKKLVWKPHDWKVVHLGTSSAIPTRKRNVSSTAFLHNNPSGDPSMFLVDCGENTYSRLVECDWCMTHGFRWIKAIFITHLHGDHIYGLPMLLSAIGRYAQYRRREAMEKGDDSEPVIRIFGPYGVRGFLRTSLYWTSPVGVKFSVSELVPRNSDFWHITPFDKGRAAETFIKPVGSEEFVPYSPDFDKQSPPPHPEEVRADDVSVGEDGTWHVFEENDGDVCLEVVAAPLKHRLPCFGYVFREKKLIRDELTARNGKSVSSQEYESLNGTGVTKSSSNHLNGNGKTNIEVDMDKARALGVYGSQFRVLRSGRPVIASKTGKEVTPEDVAVSVPTPQKTALNHPPTQQRQEEFSRKVTILGDTCDSSLIAEAAHGSDLILHEATFTESMKAKAKQAMHSTAKMAGNFAAEIEAKKLVLFHFSSRFEAALSWNNKSEENEDLWDENEDDDFENVNFVVAEASQGFKGPIIAAADFMMHDISASTVAHEEVHHSDFAAVQESTG